VDNSDQHREELQRELAEALERRLPCGCQSPEQLSEMFAQQLSLGMMTDLVSYAIPLDLEVKQQLLAEHRVDVRAQLLLDHLERQSAREMVGAAAQGFPPAFSVN
jgi:hypothetical protein